MSGPSSDVGTDEMTTSPQPNRPDAPRGAGTQSGSAGREPVSPPRPPTPEPSWRNVARETLPPRSVSELVQETLQTMTALMRARRIHHEVRSDSSRRVRQYGTLRRALLVFLADTVQTARDGSRILVRTRDLAGDRVEVAIEDESDAPSIVERAVGPGDRSGRSTTIRDALRDLERHHSARIYVGVENGKRRLLMDVGFPGEE